MQRRWRNRKPGVGPQSGAADLQEPPSLQESPSLQKPRTLQESLALSGTCRQRHPDAPPSATEQAPGSLAWVARAGLPAPAPGVKYRRCVAFWQGGGGYPGCWAFVSQPFGCQPFGASSKPAKSNAGDTVQPTSVQSPSGRAACQACGGTTP